MLKKTCLIGEIILQGKINIIVEFMSKFSPDNVVFLIDLRIVKVSKWSVVFNMIIFHIFFEQSVPMKLIQSYSESTGQFWLVQQIKSGGCQQTTQVREPITIIPFPSASLVSVAPAEAPPST